MEVQGGLAAQVRHVPGGEARAVGEVVCNVVEGLAHTGQPTQSNSGALLESIKNFWG
jgi:hypothetical protein